jgi:hypothetical protein
MLCDLITRKNIKLGILQTFWKSVHIKELSYTIFRGFQAKWVSYGHNYSIVYRNDPILCTYVPLEMANNVHLECFTIIGIQSSFFIFSAPKMGSFVKHLPKICFKNGPTQFYRIIYHILCIIHQLFASKKFSRLPSRNRQIYVDSVESGSNLNYRYFIVCSYFFQKSFLGTQVSI